MNSNEMFSIWTSKKYKHQIFFLEYLKNIKNNGTKTLKFLSQKSKSRFWLYIFYQDYHRINSVSITRIVIKTCARETSTCNRWTWSEAPNKHILRRTCFGGLFYILKNFLIYLQGTCSVESNVWQVALY